MKDAEPERRDFRGPGPAVAVEIPPGELLDRIAGLEVRAARLPGLRARRRAAARLAELIAARDSALPATERLDALAEALREANADGWAVERDLRACESREDFGPGFVALARALRRLEGRRAALRAEIDRALGSAPAEEEARPDA
jgi:hypothetical protein